MNVLSVFPVSDLCCHPGAEFTRKTISRPHVLVKFLVAGNKNALEPVYTNKNGGDWNNKGVSSGIQDE